MDREFISRGKRVDNGEWVEGCHICTNSGRRFIKTKKTITPHFCNDVLEVIPETVGQYTGKELNEEKLFVGDIVESYEDYDDMWGDPKTGYARSVVVWDKNNFCYAFDTDGYIQPFSDCNWENSAKIGNIHDNPEMMGGETNV